MIDFEDGAPIQLDAGMRMNGNASRNANRGKHNFRLAFRNEYGAGKLNFPLFGEDAPTETFNWYATYTYMDSDLNTPVCIPVFDG